jgi:hypothetical protein
VSLGLDSLISERQHSRRLPALQVYRELGGVEGRALFRNIYFSCKPFRDHNWNDFSGDLRQDQEPYIEIEFRRCYAGPSGPEPYFYKILPVTLTPESFESFLRSANLPIAARDYYLSKLFQFLYVPLVLKFRLEDNPTEVRQRLEEFLDGIPPEYTERLGEFDWSEFYDDTLCYDLHEVLRRLPLHLPVPKREPSAERMTQKRWVDEEWPSRLRQVRGTDPQKVAAQRCGVSVETYKKWEQGVRPPAPRCMDAVRQFTADLKSET